MPSDDPAVAALEKLTEALAKLQPNTATDSLKAPQFDWTTSDQYEDFRLFRKGMDSWYTLQNMPAEPDDGRRLEFLLNFLGTAGRKKFEQWTPAGETAAERDAAKQSANAFMDYLHSSMDHPVSQRCRIYQLEEIRIKAGETPDELVERIRSLAERCNFPSTAEKERHVQFRFVRALNDPELVRKLLTLKMTATTTEMLETCRTHIAISDNMDSMGLSKKTVSVIQRQGQQRHRNPKSGPTHHECGNCTKKHPPGRASCPAKDSTCKGCGKTGHWKPKCRSSGSGQTQKKTDGSDKRPRQNRHGSRSNKKHADTLEMANDDDPYLDEVGISA